MPIGLDTTRTFAVVLESDKDGPEKEQPRFIFRFLSTREFSRMGEMADSIDDLKEQGIVPVLAAIVDTVLMGLVSWENMVRTHHDGTTEAIEFDPATAGDVLQDITTPAELQEMMHEVMETVQLGPDTKKGFASQSPSNSGRSAKAAPRAARATNKKARKR